MVRAHDLWHFPKSTSGKGITWFIKNRFLSDGNFQSVRGSLKKNKNKNKNKKQAKKQNKSKQNKQTNKINGT